MSFAAPPPPRTAPASAPAQVSSAHYGFAGSELGETLAAWRTAKPGRASIACAPAVKHPGVETCQGFDAPIGGGFNAQDLTYRFVDGRLAQISFRSSINAFNFVTASFDKRFRQPGQVVHDRINDSLKSGRAHVTMRWRNGRSTIVFNDPLRNSTDLGVRFTLDTAASRLADVG